MVSGYKMFERIFAFMIFVVVAIFLFVSGGATKQEVSTGKMLIMVRPNWFDKRGECVNLIRFCQRAKEIGYNGLMLLD